MLRTNGYMGAGSMALLADSRAADEVTRRGREILDTVVEALRERRMVLVEADTDGVYFAVPAGWTEEQECTFLYRRARRQKIYPPPPVNI